MATFTENALRCLDSDSCNGQNPYHCSPRWLIDSKSNRSSTCSMVISLRSLLKSIPGIADPLSSIIKQTVPFPISIWGTGTACLKRFACGQWTYCQPVGVRLICSACWRVSNASPSRSFLTDSISRIFARVSTPFSARRSNTRLFRSCRFWPPTSPVRDCRTFDSDLPGRS